MQWPAVNTKFLLRTEPPQKCPPRLVTDTSQGYSPGLASCPPTTLPVLLRIVPQLVSATAEHKQ